MHSERISESGTAAKQRLERMLAETVTRENASALLELRDIEDELQILMRLFADQYPVIERMRDGCPAGSVQGRKFLDEALTKVTGYQKLVKDMMQNAKETRDDVSPQTVPSTPSDIC